MKKGTAILLTALAAVVAIGMLVVFTQADRQEDEGAPAALDDIVIANIGPYSIYNIIAVERGYFRDNGLDARVDEYDSGASSMAALLAGEADVAVAAEFVGVVTLFDDEDVRILANVSRHQVFRVIGRKDVGVASPSDLAGKRIGVTRGTHGEFYLDRFLAANGVAESDVEKVDLAPPDMIRQLKDGSLDAVIIFEPHAYAIEGELGNEVVAWPAQHGRDALALVYTTRSVTERRSDVIVRYLRSLLMADAYLKRHPAEARALVAESLAYDDAYEAYVWPKFDFYVGLGQEVLIRMEEQARFLIASGAVDASVPVYLDAIYFPGLEGADPSVVTIAH